MYVGKATYTGVWCFLQGFDYGLDRQLLRAFGHWLVDSNQAINGYAIAWWACLLEEIFPEQPDLLSEDQDAEAIDHLFRRLSEFLEETSRHDNWLHRPWQIQLVEQLSVKIPLLRPVYLESVADTSAEVLPHLIIANYERWFEKAIASDGHASQQALQLLHELESALLAHPAALDNVVAVSFVEHLPPASSDLGKRIHAALGPRLSDIYATIWSIEQTAS